MHLALHQLRKDLCQFHRAILVWFALLALDLCVSLGWVSQPRFNEFGLVDPFTPLWSLWLPAAVAFLAILLTAGVILTDAPGKADGFLVTRPLPRAAFWWGKAAFLFLVMVAPSVLQESVLLSWAGEPAGLVARALLERLVFESLLVLVIAALASLWPDVKSALVGAIQAAVWVLVGGLAAKMITALASVQDGLQRGTEDPTQQQLGLGLAILGLGLTVAACFANRRHGSIMRRHVLVSGTAFVAAGIAIGLPWELFPLRGEDPDLVRARFANGHVTIPLTRLSVLPVSNRPANSAAVEYNVGATPSIDGLPSIETVTWSSGGATAQLGPHAPLPLRGAGQRKPVFDWRPLPSETEVAAFASLFPPGTRWDNAAIAVSGSVFDFLNAGNFETPKPSAETRDQLRLAINLQGHVYRWERESELPLEEGATGSADDGRWTVVGIRASNPYQVIVILRHRALKLDLTSNPRLRDGPSWPSDRFEFVIYQPTTKRAYLSTTRWMAARVAEHTAYPDRYLSISFTYHQPTSGHLLTGHPTTNTLVILRRAYLGTAITTWDSPGFLLPETVRTVEVGDRGATSGSSRGSAEVRAELDSLGSPPANASHETAGRYLLGVLDLVAVNEPGARLARDAAAERLARLVPTHLDVLLDGAAAASGGGRAVCARAIQWGALPAQQQEIIRALPRAPDLAEVLLERGWVDEARAQLAELAQAPGPLPAGALRAMVWAGDPSLYPRLIQELEVSWNGWLYEALRALPGIQPGLEAAIHRQWVVHRAQTPSSWSPEWDIFLRHGIAEALQSLLGAIIDPSDTPPPEDVPAHPWLPSLRSMVAADDLTPEERQDDQRFERWLAGHRTARFVFDPARRQFVVQAAMEDAR